MWTRLIALLPNIKADDVASPVGVVETGALQEAKLSKVIIQKTKASGSSLGRKKAITSILALNRPKPPT